MTTRMESLFQCWQQTDSHHLIHPGASQEFIATFEEQAGWRLPRDWSQLYSFANGMRLLDENLCFFPLLEDEFAVLHHSETQRTRYQKQIPNEFWIFADDGGGEQFGIWVGEDGTVHTPVVQMGEYDPTFFSIAASSLERFLLHRTAFYLKDIRSVEAWDRIGLPEAFRSENHSDNEWKRIKDWADPAMADVEDDPYEVCLEPEALAEQLEMIAETSGKSQSNVNQ